MRVKTLEIINVLAISISCNRQDQLKLGLQCQTQSSGCQSERKLQCLGIEDNTGLKDSIAIMSLSYIKFESWKLVQISDIQWTLIEKYLLRMHLNRIYKRLILYLDDKHKLLYIK